MTQPEPDIEDGPPTQSTHIDPVEGTFKTYDERYMMYLRSSLVSYHGIETGDQIASYPVVPQPGEITLRWLIEDSRQPHTRAYTGKRVSIPKSMGALLLEPSISETGEMEATIRSPERGVMLVETTPPMNVEHIQSGAVETVGETVTKALTEVADGVDDARGYRLHFPTSYADIYDWSFEEDQFAAIRLATYDTGETVVPALVIDNEVGEDEQDAAYVMKYLHNKNGRQRIYRTGIPRAFPPALQWPGADLKLQPEASQMILTPKL